MSDDRQLKSFRVWIPVEFFVDVEAVDEAEARELARHEPFDWDDSRFLAEYDSLQVDELDSPAEPSPLDQRRREDLSRDR